jgi:hypothetical protein
MDKIRKLSLAGFLCLAAAGTSIIGCNKQDNKSSVPSQIDLNAPIIKIETLDKYKEAKVVGRSYSPGFSVSKKEKVEYGWVMSEGHHEHEIPIQISQPERYFLFIEIDSKTFVREVDKNLFRDAPDNCLVMARYSEKREVTYKPGAEAEKISDDFGGLEIISLELKK